MNADACMFCGAAPCECPGKKKAKPKSAPKKQATKPRPEPKPVAPSKPRAATEVSQRKKVKVNAPARGTKPGDSDSKEFWDAVTILAAEDMLHPSEMQRLLSMYPRRPL